MKSQGRCAVQPVTTSIKGKETAPRGVAAPTSILRADRPSGEDSVLMEEKEKEAFFDCASNSTSILQNMLSIKHKANLSFVAPSDREKAVPLSPARLWRGQILAAFPNRDLVIRFMHSYKDLGSHFETVHLRTMFGCYDCRYYGVFPFWTESFDISVPIYGDSRMRTDENKAAVVVACPGMMAIARLPEKQVDQSYNPPCIEKFQTPQELEVYIPPRKVDIPKPSEFPQHIWEKTNATELCKQFPHPPYQIAVACRGGSNYKKGHVWQVQLRTWRWHTAKETGYGSGLWRMEAPQPITEWISQENLDLYLASEKGKNVIGAQLFSKSKCPECIDSA